jgi:hypothetical protein
VNRTTHRSVRPEINGVSDLAAVRDTAELDSGGTQRRVVTVPILSLHPGESPRLDGEDKAHIARLAESETPLPPILVDRRTMRVIDGMHRLMAASLKGRKSIEVEFFEGSEADAFLLAVNANVTHGLPLSLSDRRAAAARIIALLPEMSDRGVGETTGLAAATVAVIRRHSSGENQQLNGRLGRDGKRHPLMPWRAADGPRRCSRSNRKCPFGRWPGMLAYPRPRSVTCASGWNAASGPPPASRKPRRPRSNLHRPGCRGRRLLRMRRGLIRENGPIWRRALEKLQRDPSLRHTEHGRRLLRLLQISVAGAQEWPTVVSTLPPHCTASVMELASQFGQMWLCFAQELEGRARIIDPLGTFAHTSRSPRTLGRPPRYFCSKQGRIICPAPVCGPLLPQR